MNLSLDISTSDPSVIALVGPTASGKSAVAVELAKRLSSADGGCEIVSADSMQVYRHMDIGTAKPDERSRGGILHHMIDVAEPTEAYNVSRYERQASKVARRLLGEGKSVLITGGTGLYVKALVDGLNQAPKGDPAIRERSTAGGYPFFFTDASDCTR